MTTKTLTALETKTHNYTHEDKCSFLVLVESVLLQGSEFGKRVMGTYLLRGMDAAVSMVRPEGEGELEQAMRQQFPEPVVRDAIAFSVEKVSLARSGKTVSALSEDERQSLVRYVFLEW